MNSGDAPGDPGAMLDVAVSAKTLGSLRMEAIHALLSLPRVGIGIGGFLLGVPGPNAQIREAVEIPCSHARGPAFHLTSEEIDHAGELKASAAPRVLGLYVSKTRGGAEPGASDVVLFDAICPETGQIFLVIRPSTVEPVRAALFARHEDNSVRLECEWELRPPTPEEMAYDPGPEPITHANQAVVAAKAAAAKVAEPVPPAVVGVAPAAAAKTAPAPAAAEKEAVAPVIEPPPHRPWPMPAGGVLFGHAAAPAGKTGMGGRFAYAAGVMALAVAAIAGIAREHRSAAPLSLDAADDNGAIVFHWNRDAVSGAESGSLVVNDAGELSVFPLSSDGLASGAFRYVRKSDRIVAKLAVGDREARAEFIGNATAKTDSAAPADPPR